MKKWFGLFMTLLCVSFPATDQEKNVMRVGFEYYLPSASIKYGKAIGVDVEPSALTLRLLVLAIDNQQI